MPRSSPVAAGSGKRREPSDERTQAKGSGGHAKDAEDAKDGRSDDEEETTDTGHHPGGDPGRYGPLTANSVPRNPVMIRQIVVALVMAAFFGAGIAIGQNNPFGGQAVYNQVMQMRAVTPSDTVTLPQTAKAIFNGGAAACNIAVVAQGDQAGQQQTMQNIPAGTWVPVSAWRVMATGTTCTNILAGY